MAETFTPIIPENAVSVIESSEPTLEDELRAVVAMFEESENTCRESRKLAERDRDYRDHKQWTSAEEALLAKRKQPIVTDNLIFDKVEYLRGFERRMRSDPKAFPRNPQDEEMAEAATDALRYIADQANFEEVTSLCYEDLLVEGTTTVDVVLAPTKADPTRVLPMHVAWDRSFWDPRSSKKDFSDAKYKGIVFWEDTKDAIETYGDKKDAIESTTSSFSLTETFDDKPRHNIWCDNLRKRIRIVQIHYKWGDDWKVATFTKGGFLVDPEVSPYLDKEGNTTSSLKQRSAFVDRDNNRYGLIRRMISMQDEVNKRRSKLLHLLSVRQTFGSKRAIKDTQAAKNEMAKPDGHVEINDSAVFGQDFGVIPTSDMAQGQFQLLQQSMQAMSLSGPNMALSGKGTEGQSGRAIQAQQQGGAVEIEPGLDDLKQLKRTCFEAMWMMVKQFWTDPKWVRVTDDERNIKFVGLNQQITLGQKLSEMPPEQAQAIAMQYGITSPQDPRLQEVVEVQNNVSGIDVDIVIEEGPDISTLQSEQFEMLSNLAQSGLAIPPKAIIQASSIRNKDMILDEMEKGVQLPPEVQQQMAEMKQALEAAAMESGQKDQEIQRLQMEAQAAKADTGIQGAEIQLKGAETQLKSREIDLKERELALREAQAIAQIEAGVPVDGESAPAQAAPSQPAAPQQIVITSPDSMAAADGINQVVGTMGQMAESNAMGAQAILQAIEASNAQNAQNTAQLAQVILAALTAPKTATLSNGKQITVQTGAVNG